MKIAVMIRDKNELQQQLQNDDLGKRLCARGDKYLLKREQICEADLLLTDDMALSQKVRDAGKCVIGFRPGEEEGFFDGADAVVKDLQVFDSRFPEMIWCHHDDIPFVISHKDHYILRESRLEDYQAIADMIHKDCDVMKPGGVFDGSLEEEEAFRSYIQSQYRLYGFGMWTVEMPDKSVGGWFGLDPNCGFEAEGCAELGYILREDLRGKGLALQIVEDILEYAMYELELDHISATIAQTNLPSWRLARKAGFIPLEDSTHAEAVRTYIKTL